MRGMVSMMRIAGSVWSVTADGKTHLPLEGDITTDVLVVGGGMCGILVAHRLMESGIQSVVVEAKSIGGGITKNTTAKITAQHGLIYTDLIKSFGAEKARQYYEANTQAIKRYRALARQFPCDLEDTTAYVYSTNNRQKLEHESTAYDRLGIKTRFQENPALPFKTTGALGMEGQAQFHPLKLLYALANDLKIYENTFVSKINGRVAITSNGKIKANNIVLATHYPLINIPGLYFMKLYQHRSYVIALENAPILDGMYVDHQEDGHSFRTYDNLLFIGGGDHKTGKHGGGYTELRKLAIQAYPHATEKYHWATQDCMTLDKVPYIGRHRAGSDSLFVATGFNKWGMTGAMVAAELITDLIVTGKSDLTELYNPRRPMFSRQFFINVGAAAKGLLSFGSPRCTHMGCKLHWNAAEKSWDCSCHGSRFDNKGHVINNPAKRGIQL